MSYGPPPWPPQHPGLPAPVPAATPASAAPGAVDPEPPAVGAAPSGSYSAEVNLFALCGVGSASYQLTVLVDGRVVHSRTGTLTSGAGVPVPFTS